VPNVYEINKLNNVLALVTKALTTQKTARVTLAIVHQPTEQTPIRNISYIRQEMTTAHVRWNNTSANHAPVAKQDVANVKRTLPNVLRSKRRTLLTRKT